MGKRDPGQSKETHFGNVKISDLPGGSIIERDTHHEIALGKETHYGTRKAGELGGGSLLEAVMPPAQEKQAGRESPDREPAWKRTVMICGGAVAGVAALLFGFFMVGGGSRNGNQPAPTAADSRLNPSSSQPEFRIVFKTYPQVGQVILRKENKAQSLSRRFIGADNQLLKEEKTEASYEVEYTETVLEAGEKLPQRIRRSYNRAVAKLGDKAKTLGYQGRTIVFDLVGEKYEASAVGEPPVPPPELADLARRVSKPEQVEAFLPHQPVKIGRSWPIDIPRIARMIAEVGEIDVSVSSGDARLVEVAQRDDGAMFGQIKLSLKLAVKNMMEQRFYPPADLQLEAELFRPIDGSSTYGKLELKGRLIGRTIGLDLKGNKQTIEHIMQLASTEERTPEK